MKKKSAMIPCRTLRGHLDWVWGAVHLPDGQHIITCSADGSLRLWDLESCTQIGDNWQDEDDEQDEGDEARVLSLALSPNGTTVASGSSDGTVRLWGVKTGEVVGKWREYTDTVSQVCWSPDGERVVVRYSDGTVRVWDIESRKCALLRTKMTTYAMAYSPDGENIATGGHWLDEYGVKIWDPKTAELLFTIDHDLSDSSMAWSSDSQSSLHLILLVSSLAWTSDGKKLVSGSSDGSIRIFDTATWQLSAVLLGHTPDHISSLSLSWNDRLLASASFDTTVRLWDLDTNLPVGPPLKHKYYMIGCAAFSADGKLLVTCCEDENAYVWDVTAIKEAGHNDLLSIPEEVIEDDPKQKLLDTDAARRPAPRGGTYRLPPDFFGDTQDRFSATPNLSAHHRSAGIAPSSGTRPRMLFGRISSLFRRSHSSSNSTIELQPPKGRRPRVVEVATAQDRNPLYVAPPRNQQGSAQGAQTQGQQQAQSQPQASSLCPHATGAAVTSTTTTAVASTTPAPATNIKTRPWWIHIVLFICCAPTNHAK